MPPAAPAGHPRETGSKASSFLCNAEPHADEVAAREARADPSGVDADV
jgi:hypothetical protein